MNTANQHVSINQGVDFERALDTLNAKAGTAFREYRKAAAKVPSSPEQVEKLRDAWIDAQRDVEHLSRHDTQRIREILQADAA